MICKVMIRMKILFKISYNYNNNISSISNKFSCNRFRIYRIIYRVNKILIAVVIMRI